MVKIVVIKSGDNEELRAPCTPEVAKKFIKSGCDCYIESDAGLASGFANQEYTEVGATIVKERAALYQDADIILTVNLPTESDKIKSLLVEAPKNAIVIGTLNPYHQQVKALAEMNLTFCALELIPRITRAQSMDVLSSQSNLLGYRAVIEAAAAWNQAFPLMMTAAGTIVPARVLILGAGVAGLQAIATARRLGAIVSAFDVRSAAREQVESLGAKFIEVDNAAEGEAQGGYAKEMDESYKRRQAEKIASAVSANDIVISTALIPGKPAPRLITAPMVESMMLGSVIVDLAAAAGGNCELTDKTHNIEHKGIKIISGSNMINNIARDASNLYARNLYNFVQLLLDPKYIEDGKIVLNLTDEIIKAVLIAHKGEGLRA